MITYRFTVPGICLALAGILALTILGPSVARADTGAGSVGFSNSYYSVAVNAGVAFVTINRSGGSTGAATATYTTLDASALAGTDYTATSGSVSWSDGDSSPRTFLVPIAANGSGGATFMLTLLSATGASFGTTINSTVIIASQVPANAIAGMIQFSQPYYSVSPVSSLVTATVNRIQGAAGPASATITTLDGSAIAGRDYAPTSGTLVWADGDDVPRSFTVAIAPGVAGGLSFTLALISASGAAFGDPLQSSINVRQTALGTAQLSWAAPVQNTDGSPLTDLAGYYIFYGTPGTQPNFNIQIAGASTTSMAVGNLAPGTWYFAAMAYNSSGVVSDLSAVTFTTIQ